MRGFFDDLLASIFVMAVLAASYIFLFMGTVQSGTMMGNALQHRIRIEQLQSAAQAFKFLSEPNTGENLAYLVGVAANTGSSRVYTPGGQQVDTVAATEGALKQLLGSNYQLSVELPTRRIELVFIVPQSPTMIDEGEGLISSIPQIRSRLQEKNINATLFVYFLSYGACPNLDWCDNATKAIVDCSEMYLPPSRGEADYNVGAAIGQVSQVQGLGLKVVIPLTDSLSTGDGPDSCYNACNSDSSCSWCSTTCPSQRSDASLRSAALYASKNKAAVCPVLFSKCSSGGVQAQDHFSCLGIPSLSCSTCQGCVSELAGTCFPTCYSEVVRQFATIAQATGCTSKRIPTSDIASTVIDSVDTALAGNRFKVGPNPPHDATQYSEDLVLPVEPPMKARLTIW